MRNQNKASSFFANLLISRKIAAGFVLVLAILVGSSVTAWLAFNSTSGAVAQYTSLTANSGIFRDIDLALAQYRGHVREYTFSRDEAAAAAAANDGEALRKLIAMGVARVSNPERHALMNDLAKQEASYTSSFVRLRALTGEQEKLETEILDVVGRQMTDAFTTIIEGATKADNRDLIPIAIEGRRLSLMVRLDANKRLGRRDQAAAQSAEQALTGLQSVLGRLNAAAMQDADLNTAIHNTAALIDRYRTALLRATSVDAEQVSLVNGVMREAGNAMAADAVKAKDTNLADRNKVERQMLDTTANGSSRVVILGVTGLTVGAVLAWLIGRGISGPVVRMCGSMRELASGNKAVEVPGIGRKDEIGQMADTVQVFRDRMIEAENLREANERQKAEAEAGRKASMLRLADNFETGIKGIVNSVASQSTEMQSAARAMTHTAEEATQQATAVAASVEQASANVQTVASSAEELSASVQEIARQVDQSSKIAGQAVVEADRSNATVEGLNKTAQRIGEVVQLIETIAGQTNLLALNATIEAARAGDAGKGFAVVASEVKSLASQTAKATEEIRAQISEIQGATGQTVEAIRSIGATIRQMSEIATAIASAVEEQGAATREIATNVQQAAQGTGEIATNIEGVSRAAGDTGAAASQVLSSAGELSRQAETLRRDVDGFLATVRAA
jgi:methyl-accepting chemotaxis protein